MKQTFFALRESLPRELLRSVFFDQHAARPSLLCSTTFSPEVEVSETLSPVTVRPSMERSKLPAL